MSVCLETRAARRRRGLRYRLAAELAVRCDLPLGAAAAAVACVFDYIAADLAATGRAEIRGFGTWELVPARTHGLRHPGTGEPSGPRSPIDIKFSSGAELARRCGALRWRHRGEGAR